MKKAIVLLSGGLDSATTLSWALDKGWRCHCLVFDYGQRHRKEIKQAAELAKYYRTPAETVKITLPWQGSALLDKSITLPSGQDMMPDKIPVTYVPARNIIFLSFAASFAEAVGARAIFIGANAVDYSGYPDCRPEFYAAYQEALNQGLKAGVERRPVRIYTPLIRMTKEKIIRTGLKLKTPYQLTWSCYQGGRKPCRDCDSCVLRAKGFAAAGIPDPLLA